MPSAIWASASDNPSTLPPEFLPVRPPYRATLDEGSAANGLTELTLHADEFVHHTRNCKSLPDRRLTLISEQITRISNTRGNAQPVLYPGLQVVVTKRLTIVITGLVMRAEAEPKPHSRRNESACVRACCASRLGLVILIKCRASLQCIGKQWT